MKFAQRIESKTHAELRTADHSKFFHFSIFPFFRCGQMDYLWCRLLVWYRPYQPYGPYHPYRPYRPYHTPPATEVMVMVMMLSEFSLHEKRMRYLCVRMPISISIHTDGIPMMGISMMASL